LNQTYFREEVDKPKNKDKKVSSIQPAKKFIDSSCKLLLKLSLFLAIMA